MSALGHGYDEANIVRAPTSGGQYHWVSEFAPPSCQKFLSYVVGWLGVLGWQTAAATVSYLTGKQLQALIILWNPTYEPKAWQGTLLIWAVLAVCLLFNTFFSRKLPLIEGVIVVLHIAGFFAVIIPLWVMGDRSNTGDVFTLFQDNMGWGSVSLSTMIGLTGAASCFVGVEAGAHMSEEVRNAAHVVPRAMMWTWLGNGLMGWIMAITFCFCVGDTMSVLLTPLGAQQVQVFLNTTGSAAGATGLTCIMLVIGVFACVAVMATNSRQLFAFARDNGVPFSSTFSKVSQMKLVYGILRRLTSAGLTDIRGAGQLSIRDHYIRVAAFVDQPRLERCLHAGHLSRRCCDVYIIPDLDRMCGIEEDPGRAFAAFQIQPRTVGTAHQHHRCGFPPLPVDLCVLSVRTSPGGRGHELGDFGLWSRSYFRSGVVCRPWSARVRWTS